MRVIVDADACPVTDIIIEETQTLSIPVYLVKSYDHFSISDYPNHVKTQYVDSGNDAVDYVIVKQVEPNDIVITQDYGLAALCLPKRCIVLHHQGYRFTQENIESKLMNRHLNAKARKAGQRTKGPKKFTKEHKEIFRSRFRKIIQSV